MSKSNRILLVAMIAGQPISTLAEPLETFQLGNRIDVAGRALGTSRSYKITTSTSRTVLFSVIIDPSCHYTLQKGALRDVQPSPVKAPIEFSDEASIGEVYVLSFSQTRPAWQANRPCAYSFSLK